MIYTHGVSDEPLEIIRANECDAQENLATSRFRALWNEIERLKKDAERYRWLRSGHSVGNGEPFIGRHHAGVFSQWTGEYADGAIDVAMAPLIDRAAKEE